MSAIACFTFDNMAEAADVGAGLCNGPRADGSDPSLRMGFPKLFALLERYGVRGTFFVEGWNGIHHPDAVAEIVLRGHELGMHGWVHEPWARLDRDEEAALAARATAALESAAGVRPVGFRAPGGARSPHTESILTELGYLYDASLGEGMQPRLLPSGLAQVPFVWPAVDGFHYLRPEPADPNRIRDTWLNALGRAADRGGLFLLICHAFITGVDDDRLAALEAILQATVRDPRIRVCTGAQTARELLAAARPCS
jgi:peptidoglycan-N-acetylglucosamine deacetylase